MNKEASEAAASPNTDHMDTQSRSSLEHLRKGVSLKARLQEQNFGSHKRRSIDERNNARLGACMTG